MLARVLGRVEVSDRFAAAFLRPPLFSTDYARGLGTLYTAVYHPGEGVADYRRPDVVWRQSLDSFREGRRTIRLLETTAA